jgi:hypothetical protein
VPKVISLNTTTLADHSDSRFDPTAQSVQVFICCPDRVVHSGGPYSHIGTRREVVNHASANGENVLLVAWCVDVEAP